MTRLVLPFLFAAVLHAEEPRIVPGMNAFTTACYRQLARGGDANLILSPFNIGTALSMLLGGARGQTGTEIGAVLRQRYEPAYDPALAGLIDQLTKAANTPGNELLAANGVWVQKSFSILPDFQNALANHYRAPLIRLDFMANAEGAREQINRWTALHTKDKIKDLFPPGALNFQARLVLTSAIYFYGKWQEPFLRTRTAPAAFKLASGAATQTTFMHQTSHFRYTETPSAQILEMPYAGTGIAFDVLLPKAPVALSDLEASLSSENLSAWWGELETRNVEVMLPNFRAESEFSLRQALSAMGMQAAFTSRADFSGIDGKRDLNISEVMHKAFVDVSEQGTEAAAATGIAVYAAAMRVAEPPVVFRADHPFVFLIRDTRTGVVLFIGRLERIAHVSKR